MSTARADQPTPEIIRRAAEWAAQLDDGPVATVRAACDVWCDEDPRHRVALDRMRALDTRFERLEAPARGTLARLADEHGRARSLRLGGGLLAIAAMLLAGHAALQSFALGRYFPDYQTATGEQRAIALADGSKLLLDTASRADVDLRAKERMIRLFDGQLLAEVAPDPARPFSVETGDGRITALGTAFTVRRDPDATIVTVLESRVRVCPAEDDDERACIRLQAGESARLTQTGATALGTVDIDAIAAWTRGWIEADDRPVAELLTEINRYRRDPIRFNPAGLANVRVTGSYPLNDSVRAVAAIAGAADLRLRREGDGGLLVTRR